MSRPPAPAAALTVTVDAAGRLVRFPYTVDERPGGEIMVEYPFALDDRHAPLLGPIATGVATYLGQLCLAREIRVAAEVDPATAEGLAPIAAMLYDVRCWKDERPLLSPPRFVFPRESASHPRRVPAPGDRALLLFSGGKDSTLAALALERNSFSVEALHITANGGVEDSEAAAVARLAERLQLDVLRVDYRHDDFDALSRAYAVNWNAFPHFNAVPFGRDLLLSLLAVPVLVERGIPTLSLGHDRDCRTARVTYGGRTFPRNDIESADGAMALERYMRRFLVAEARMLPPLARISELRILREMFEGHPDLMAETAFCFWGGRCGRCAKCLRYFLAQRLFGQEGTLRFDANPLAAGVCPELDDILDSWAREPVLFDREVLYGLGRLVERGDVRRGEGAAGRFRSALYSDVAPLLDEWETELMAVGDDPQVPPAFVPVDR